MSIKAIKIQEKLSLLSTYWDPKIVGEINGQDVKVAKLKGEFIWHNHKDTDEMFLVVKGHLIIHFRDKDIYADEGEVIIIPKGIEHKPEAPKEVYIILIDSKGTVNTGSVKSGYTIKRPTKI